MPVLVPVRVTGAFLGVFVYFEIRVEGGGALIQKYARVGTNSMACVPPGSVRMSCCPCLDQACSRAKSLDLSTQTRVICLSLLRRTLTLLRRIPHISVECKALIGAEGTSATTRSGLSAIAPHAAT